MFKLLFKALGLKGIATAVVIFGILLSVTAVQSFNSGKDYQMGVHAMAEVKDLELAQEAEAMAQKELNEKTVELHNKSVELEKEKANVKIMYEPIVAKVKHHEKTTTNVKCFTDSVVSNINAAIDVANGIVPPDPGKHDKPTGKVTKSPEWVESRLRAYLDRVDEHIQKELT